MHIFFLFKINSEFKIQQKAQQKYKKQKIWKYKYKYENTKYKKHKMAESQAGWYTNWHLNIFLNINNTCYISYILL